MAKSNIKRFDEISADVLAHLYESFPMPVKLSPTVAGLSVLTVLSYDPVSEESEMEGDLDPETDFFNATVDWLVDSGFISVKSSSFGERTYTLTTYGLQSLKHVPKPAINEDTLGEQLTAAAKGGLKEVASAVLNQALSVGTGLMLAPLGMK